MMSEMKNWGKWGLRMRLSAWTNFLIFFSRRSTLIYFSPIYADFFLRPSVFYLRISAFNICEHLREPIFFFLADQRWFFSAPSAFPICAPLREPIYFLSQIYADLFLADLRRFFFHAHLCFYLRISVWNNLWNILPLNFMDILHSFVGLRCAAAPDCVITFSFSTNIIAATQLHPSIFF